MVGRRMVSPIFPHNVFKETGDVLDLHLPIPIPARVNENVGSPSTQYCQVIPVGDGIYNSLVSSDMSHLSHLNAQPTPSGMICNCVGDGVENVHTRGTTSAIPCSVGTNKDMGYSITVDGCLYGGP
jgi:hypothetical protein